jgi:phage-related minor tail protein
MADEEIKVLLTAEPAQLQAGMEAGAASVTQATDAMRASVAEAMSQYAAFDAIQKGSITTAVELAAAQKTLADVQASGAFTAEELGAKEAIIASAMTKIGTETKAASGALSAFTANSRTMYSASALVTDALSGQFSRSRREVAALANETGIMGAVFRVAAGPIGIAAAIIGTLAVAAVEGAENSQKLEDAIAATGDAIGVTYGQLAQLKDGMIDSDTSAGEATAAISKLALSGHFLGDSLADAARAAQGMAELTGQSMDSAVASIERLGKDPVKAIKDLEDQYHFLSVPEAQEIANLIKLGDKAGAAALAVRDLANAEASREKDSGHGDSWFDRVKNSFHGGAAFFEQIGGTKPLQKQLNEATEQLNEYIAHRSAANAKLIEMAAANGTKYAPTSGDNLEGVEQINALLAQRKAIKDQIAQQDATAAATAKQTAETTQSVDKILPKSGGAGHVAGDLEKRLQDEEAEQKISYDHRAQFEMEYWGEILQTSKAGTAEYTVAWKNIQTLQKSLDHAQLEEWKKNQHEMAMAARKAATEAAKAHRKMSQEAMDALEMQRAGTASNTAERIQADAAILASATKLYGAMSSQQKAALSQMLADEKAYDASVRALKTETLTAARDESIRAIANKRSEYQLQYSEGNISAKQLLQLEEQLAAQKLAIDKKYFQDKEKLDIGEPIAIAKDEAGIVKAHQVATASMTAAEKEFHSNSLKEWQGYAQKVEGAMQGAINGMLFQHQTLRQGVANVALVIGEDFIQKAVMKPLDAWISAEASKVAASLSTSTTLQAQRVANGVADAAASTASVMRATGVAGAQGIASFAGAPWPIDMGAPAFGAAMAASAASFGSVASAAGGWERVPFDGAMTELHRDEMVLPKHVADPIRQMAQGGGGGGGQVHIHANDAKSFKDMLRRNPGALAGALRHAGRMGH